MDFSARTSQSVSESDLSGRAVIEETSIIGDVHAENGFDEKKANPAIFQELRHDSPPRRGRRTSGVEVVVPTTEYVIKNAKLRGKSDETKLSKVRSGPERKRTLGTAPKGLASLNELIFPGACFMLVFCFHSLNLLRQVERFCWCLPLVAALLVVALLALT